jgi:hypothetical protein
MSKGNWGADTTDERKPTWPWVSEYIGYANCFATGGGWTVRWPWGDEVIVALSNLTTKLGTATETEVLLGTIGGSYAVLANVSGEAVSVIVAFNEAVHVTGTPTLDLVSTAGEANITLSYNAASSNLETGKVVFSNQSFTLGTAGYAGNTLIADANSTVSNWDTIHDAASSVAVANGIPSGLQLVIPVYQEKPVHVATLRVGTAKDTTNQQIGFALDFNDVVQVTGVPYIIAIGPNTDIANTKLSYNAAASNLALGNLVFQSDPTDFSALTGNCQFTLTTNGASTNSSDGWSGIKGPLPLESVVAHGVIVANTFTVVQNEPFFSALLDGANVTNSTAQVVTFGVKFDRAVVVTGAIPTITAIGTSGLANLTLTYASGNGTANIVFSSAATDMSALANGTWVVNASSTLTNFSAISNTGVAFSANSIAGSAANTVALVSA